MEKLFLSIEIGATKQQLAIAKSNGELIEVYQEKLILKKGAEDILEWIKVNVPILMNRKQEYKDNIVAIGAGFGGPIETKQGRIISSIQVKGWENFKLKNWLEKEFLLPAIVINDTVAGGFSELICGKGKNANNMFYTNIGSGIGGALFIDRNYFDGSGKGACYLGHTYVPDFTNNSKGSYAKVEEICSGFGIEKRLRQKNYVPVDSEIFSLCDGKIDTITCYMLSKAAYNNDKFALEEIDRIAHSYSIGLCNAITITGTELIIIGGGVAKMGDILFSAIRKYVNKYEFIANANNYTIEQSQLLDDAVICGAALSAANAYNNNLF